MATWPAAIDIGDSRLVTGEPLTADLFKDYCDRDDELQDCANPMTLVRITGRYMVAGVPTYRYIFSVRTATAAGDFDIYQQLHAYIPEGCVRLNGAVVITLDAYNPGECHAALKIGGVKGPTVDMTGIGPVLYPITHDAPPVGTFCEIILTVWRTGGVNRTFTVPGMLIWSEMV